MNLTLQPEVEHFLLSAVTGDSHVLAFLVWFYIPVIRNNQIKRN